jgi:hypothetical protein
MHRAKKHEIALYQTGINHLVVLERESSHTFVENVAALQQLVSFHERLTRRTLFAALTPFCRSDEYNAA